MNCRNCQEEMKLISVNDNPNEDFAYNVYHCFDCMILCKQDVWTNGGTLLWITKRNDITTTYE